MVTNMLAFENYRTIFILIKATLASASVAFCIFTLNLRKGITSAAEPEFFEAIKDFQRRHFLFVDGQIHPEDRTIETINDELENPNNFMIFKSQYIWRLI